MARRCTSSTGWGSRWPSSPASPTRRRRAQHPGPLSARADGRAGDLARSSRACRCTTTAPCGLSSRPTACARPSRRQRQRGRCRLRVADARRRAESVEHGKPGVAVRPAAAARRSPPAPDRPRDQFAPPAVVGRRLPGHGDRRRVRRVAPARTASRMHPFVTATPAPRRVRGQRADRTARPAPAATEPSTSACALPARASRQRRRVRASGASTVNGKPVERRASRWDALPAVSRIEIAPGPPAGRRTGDPPRRTPIPYEEDARRVRPARAAHRQPRAAPRANTPARWRAGGKDVRYTLYRDGLPFAADLAAGAWHRFAARRWLLRRRSGVPGLRQPQPPQPAALCLGAAAGPA